MPPISDGSIIHESEVCIEESSLIGGKSLPSILNPLSFSSVNLCALCGSKPLFPYTQVRYALDVEETSRLARHKRRWRSAARAGRRQVEHVMTRNNAGDAPVLFHQDGLF